MVRAQEKQPERVRIRDNTCSGLAEGPHDCAYKYSCGYFRRLHASRCTFTRLGLQTSVSDYSSDSDAAKPLPPPRHGVCPTETDSSLFSFSY